MRLFIAINFNEEIKEKLKAARDNLKELSRKGNFTRDENLHLTLVFIGETQRFSDIAKIMDETDFAPFEIAIKGGGYFKRRGGNLYYAKVLNNENLTSIYNALYTKLTRAGFNIEDRPYTPHITLGREVILSGDFDITYPEAVMKVEKISLMKSERINGALTYTGIYEKRANEEA